MCKRRYAWEESVVLRSGISECSRLTNDEVEMYFDPDAVAVI